jgi:hypothetical protein
MPPFGIGEVLQMTGIAPEAYDALFRDATHSGLWWKVCEPEEIAALVVVTCKKACAWRGRATPIPGAAVQTNSVDFSAGELRTDQMHSRFCSVVATWNVEGAGGFGRILRLE